jgi:hypothetical protein
MKAIMNLNALKNTEELQSFLDGSPAVAFGYVASIIENEARLVFRHNYPAKAINGSVASTG